MDLSIVFREPKNQAGSPRRCHGGAKEIVLWSNARKTAGLLGRSWALSTWPRWMEPSCHAEWWEDRNGGLMREDIPSGYD